MFRHSFKQLIISVHGDDFTSGGAKEDLDLFEAKMQEHYECTVQPRVAPGDEDSKEGIVLNRVVRCGPLRGLSTRPTPAKRRRSSQSAD